MRCDDEREKNQTELRRVAGHIQLACKSSKHSAERIHSGASGEQSGQGFGLEDSSPSARRCKMGERSLYAVHRNEADLWLAADWWLPCGA